MTGVPSSVSLSPLLWVNRVCGGPLVEVWAPSSPAGQYLQRDLGWSCRGRATGQPGSPLPTPGVCSGLPLLRCRLSSSGLVSSAL